MERTHTINDEDDEVEQIGSADISIEDEKESGGAHLLWRNISFFAPKTHDDKVHDTYGIAFTGSVQANPKTGSVIQPTVTRESTDKGAF